MVFKHINVTKFSKGKYNNDVNAKIIKNNSVAFTNNFGQDVRNVKPKTLYYTFLKVLGV